MFVQHVIDQIGGHGDLPTGFFLARMALFNQAGNQSCIAKGALHHEAFAQPGFQIIAQHILVKQGIEAQLAPADHQGQITQTPHAQRIIGGDKAKRSGLHAFQTPCQQHAQGLMRQTPLKRIGNEVMLVRTGKGFHQQFTLSRQNRPRLLDFQPLRHLIRQ